MFDPASPESIRSVEDKDLARLPGAEDNLHEYKSSLTRDNDLADKIVKAASGFWNSGGGLFVAGVDGNGRSDGGCSLLVGKTARRDWIDQTIHKVDPQAAYSVKLVENTGSCPTIKAGNAVILIGFARSEWAPHMAPDGKYYIRAGAHTAPAGHFLVEAIRARRQFLRPRLVHLARIEPFTTASLWMSVELVSVTGGAALNVRIDLDPRPTGSLVPGFPLLTSLIDTGHPYSFRFETPSAGYSGKLTVEYEDLLTNPHKQEIDIASHSGVSPFFERENPLDRIAQGLERLNNTVSRLAR